MHTYNHNNWGRWAGRLKIQGHPGLHTKTLSQNSKQYNNDHNYI